MPKRISATYLSSISVPTYQMWIWYRFVLLEVSVQHMCWIWLSFGLGLLYSGVSFWREVGRSYTLYLSTCWFQDSGFPCFKGGPRAIQNLRKRFHLSLTEEVSFITVNLSILCHHLLLKIYVVVFDYFKQQCVSLVLSLISSSLDAWRTRQYDYYQRVLNGILWGSIVHSRLKSLLICTISFWNKQIYWGIQMPLHFCFSVVCFREP